MLPKSQGRPAILQEEDGLCTISWGGAAKGCAVQLGGLGPAQLRCLLSSQTLEHSDHGVTSWRQGIRLPDVKVLL